jgi:hypothetical protein
MQKETFVVGSIFICILILIYSSTFFKKNSLLDRFVTRVPIASHFIIGIGIYITFLLLKLNFKDSSTKESIQALKDSTVNTLDILEKYNERCPTLINSFFFPWQNISSKNNYDSDAFNGGNDDKLAAFIVSNKIFENVGIYIHGACMTVIGDAKYLIFFSSFFRSKLLKAEWDNCYGNFDFTTRLVCNKLFEINDKNKFKNVKELVEYFENYTKTLEFKTILNSEDPTNVSQATNIF